MRPIMQGSVAATQCRECRISLGASLLIVSLTFSNFDTIHAGERTEKWDLGAGIGAVTGSPGGTQFAELFSADYYIKDSINDPGPDWGFVRYTAISIGPMIQLVTPGDFSQVAGALVGKLHVGLCGDANNCPVKIVPFMGLGGLHSEVKQGNLNSKDTSYYATVGLSLDWDLNPRAGLSATYMNSMYDIHTGTGRDRDNSALFVSVRFRIPSK